MLFAVHYRDRPAFDALWQWTQKNLQVRDDALLAWRWERGRGVTDRNNAADGDILVAWALLRAAEAWRQPEYAAAGTRIAQDVRKRLLRRVPHGLVLVPGLEGFEKPEGLTINLSVLGVSRAARARARRSRARVGRPGEVRGRHPAVLVFRPLAPAARLAPPGRAVAARDAAGALRL